MINRELIIGAIRVKRSQIALVVFIALNVILLISSTITFSNDIKQDSKIFTNTKNIAHSLALIQRETLAYTTKFAQWEAGDVERREVQLARAFLAQRLSVKTFDNVPDGFRLDEIYFKNLLVSDKILSNSKPGILARDDYRAIRADAKVFINSMLIYSRDFSFTYRVQLDKTLEVASKKQAAHTRTNIFLMVSLFFFLFVLIFSLVSTLSKNIKTNLSSIQSQHVLIEEANNKFRKLKALDQRKSEFISTINHELRTPLTSIIGYTNILQRNAITRSDSQTGQLVEVIIRNSEILMSLVEETLTLAKLESNSTELIKTDFDVQVVIAEVTFALTPQASKAGIIFVLNVQENIDTIISANQAQIFGAIQNLLSNALKFSKTQSEVQINISKVHTEESVAMIRIAITDQGVGIPQSQTTEIFSSFYRASNVQNSGIPGSGLGLAIVKQIVQLHNGSIGVESTEGVGSTFTLELPTHDSDLVKFISNKKCGVLERSISAIKNSDLPDLGRICHEMIGALGFYELQSLSNEIALFSDWLSTNGDADESEISSRRASLLMKLESGLIELRIRMEA